MGSALRLRIRLDYRGVARGRFLFGSRNSQQVAEDSREQKVNLLRNLPLQGIEIEQVDMQPSTYTLYDEARGVEVTYAPVVLTLRAESLEDVVRMLFWEEFRKVEILEPEELVLDRHQLERLLFRIGEGAQETRVALEKKLAGR
ncbi:MAG: hypothetical protein QHH27_02075 [Clostridia bacterium]|nr:hypothetical protein [Clostridia bacterium]MDH7572322.1 hypothetical protein [Clostridia bacterium]